MSIVDRTRLPGRPGGFPYLACHSGKAYRES